MVKFQYKRLDNTDYERQATYSQIFKQRIPNDTLTEIREAANEAWALGNDRFKQRTLKKRG